MQILPDESLAGRLQMQIVVAESAAGIAKMQTASGDWRLVPATSFFAAAPSVHALDLMAGPL
jgi:hypothetical protein